MINNPSASIREIGNIIKHSKIEYTWSFFTTRPVTITLLDSRISGKRRVQINNKQVYFQRTFSLFTYTFIYQDMTFSIVEYAEEKYELYIDQMPFSRLIEPVDDRICDGSFNSRKNIYLEFISNEENGCDDSISPRRVKSDKENRNEVRYKSREPSNIVAKKVDELFA